jgi:phospholipid transport system substrate-binding protein
MKSLMYAIAFTLVISQTALPDDKDCVRELIQSKLEAVTLVLQKKNVDQQIKNSEIVDIVSPMFDFSLMARLTLGKKYWPALTQEKKERFTALFVDLLKAFSVEKLALYTDEKIVYKTPLQIKKKIHIPTELISQDNNIGILYKLYRSKNGWKIYDIEIQGVSVIATYRSQFDQVLRSGNIDDLLLKLEQTKDQ